MGTPAPTASARLTLITAAVTAAAAVGGTVAGGVATYLGSRSLQHEQSRSAALGAARVLRAELESSMARLQAELGQHHMKAPDALSTITASADDERLMASHMAGTDWADVKLALEVLAQERQ